MASKMSLRWDFPAMLLLLAAVVAAASALPVSVNNADAVPAPEGAAGAGLPNEALLVLAQTSIPRGALQACNTGACIQRCRNHWSRGGSCQRGLCICV